MTEYIDIVRQAILKVARPSEKLSLLVFPSPIRSGIIVSIGGRAHFLSDATLDANATKGSWDGLAAHVLRCLRRPHPMSPRPTYTFAEMLTFAPYLIKALKESNEWLNQPPPPPVQPPQPPSPEASPRQPAPLTR